MAYTVYSMGIYSPWIWVDHMDQRGNIYPTADFNFEQFNQSWIKQTLEE